jgi:hypothetical protein
MFQALLALVLVPAYVFADVKLYSPANITPADLASSEFVSVSKGTNFIADLGFKEQRNIVDEILGAVGSLNFSGSLIETDFDVNDNPAKARIRAKVSIDKRVYASNYGEVDANGQPLSPLRSVYTVVDEAKNELQFESEIKLNSIVKIEPLNVHAAVAVKRIYEVGSLQHYRNRRTSQESLEEIGVAVTDGTDTTSSYTKKPGRILESFNKVLTAAESIFRLGAEYFADEEKTKIFLENVLDPLRIDAEFFRLTAEKLRDSKSVQVGEILVHSVYVRILPAGIGLKKDVVDVSYFPKAYTIAIHSAFKKVSPTEVIAKSILEIRKGREFKASVELMNTGWEPIRWDSTAYNFEMKEYGYKFDLAKQEHVAAFNGIFSKRWFSRDIKQLPGVVNNFASLQNPDYLIFTKDRETPTTNQISRFRAEFFVASYSSKTFRPKLEKLVTKDESTGQEVTEYFGQTGKASRFRIRVGFKGMKENEDTKRELKSYVRIDSGTQPKAELAFEYLFSDQYSSQAEFNGYVNFVKMALAANELAPKSEAMRNIVRALDRRVNEKKDRDDPQYLNMRLSISTALTNAIFNNPENLENIKFFIGRLFLGNNYTKWSDIANPEAPNPRFPRECRDLVLNEHALVFSLSHQTSCFALGAIAKSIYSDFQKISATTDSAERLSILNNLFKNRNFRAYVPLLILQLATVEKIENGVATYKSIDGMLENGELGFELVVDGNGLEFPFRLDFDNTTILQRFKLAQDFDFIDLNNGERRLQQKGAYVRASEVSSPTPTVYIRINSNIDFSNNYRAVGRIRDFKLFRADKDIANISLDKLIPVEEHYRGFSDKKAFSYLLAIPNGETFTLAKKNDYVVELQVVDNNGNYVTEVIETKFTLR